MRENRHECRRRKTLTAVEVHLFSFDESQTHFYLSANSPILHRPSEKDAKPRDLVREQISLPRFGSPPKNIIPICWLLLLLLLKIGNRQRTKPFQRDHKDDNERRRVPLALFTLLLRGEIFSPRLARNWLICKRSCSSKRRWRSARHDRQKNLQRVLPLREYYTRQLAASDASKKFQVSRRVIIS